MKIIKVLFVSNYLNFHQTLLWDKFIKFNDVEFKFLSTKTIKTEIKPEETREYNLYSHNFSDIQIKKFIESFDVIIIGACSDRRIFKYLPKDKIIFHNSEHYWKKINTPISFMKRVYRMITLKMRYKYIQNFYLLANSSRLMKEFDIFKIKYKTCFKFGYFPPVCNEYPNLNARNNMVFIGRLIKLKHPEYSLHAFTLLSKNNSSTLSFYGEGPIKKRLIKMCKNNRSIQFNPFISHEDVLKTFKESNVFVFSSNREEGWGAVLNEALSCGCVVFACSAAGSTNFLIKDGFNGFTFKNKDELTKKINIFQSLDECSVEKIRIAAFETINLLWNADIAANRLHETLISILKGNEEPLYNDGPLSNQKF